MTCDKKSNNVVYITLLLTLQTIIIIVLLYILIYKNKFSIFRKRNLYVSQQCQCDLNNSFLQHIIINPDSSLNITAL